MLQGCVAVCFQIEFVVCLKVQGVAEREKGQEESETAQAGREGGWMIL